MEQEKKSTKPLVRWLLKLVSVGLCVVYGALLAAMVELSIRGDWNGVREFYETGVMSIWLNIAIAAAVVGVFFALSNRLWVGFICSLILFGLMGFVNISKMKYHDVPFLPWDIYFIKDALRVAPALSSQGMDATSKLYLETAGGLFVIAVIAFFLIDWFIKGKRGIIDYLVNIVLLILCLSLLAGLSYESRRRANFFSEHSILNYFWNQRENVINNGQILTFTMNVSNIIVPKPANYTPSTMEKVSKEVAAFEVDGEEKPDIVVIMSESFSDPMKIEGLSFEKDPLPHFREIGEEGIHGDLMVSVIGGKTANTEFEFLTGYAVRLLPEGSVPYQQHVKNDIESLPRFLKTKGYYTTAIHNNIPEFWNRSKVYPYMGFDRFLDINDFKNPTMYGNWMSDRDLTDKVIEALEEDKGKDNNFVFAVTVQNHAPYDTPAEVEDIEVTGELSEADLTLMKKYVRGISVSDKELYRLYEYLKQREKKTVLCFFGDHLPGGFEMLYRSFPHYVNVKKNNNDIGILSTPYIIWSNYRSDPEHRDIGASAAAALMLEYADADRPAMQNYNLSQYKDQKPSRVYYHVKGLQEPLKTYRDYQYLMMYDDLFGKKYYNKK